MISNDEGRFSGLFGQISDPHALTLAFEKVRRNNGCAGGDGQSIAAFAAKGAAAIARLSGLLRNGNYAPRPLRLHEIPKPDGGTRRLAIPAVSDRIVQTAVAAALTPGSSRCFPPTATATAPAVRWRWRWTGSRPCGGWATPGWSRPISKRPLTGSRMTRCSRRSIPRSIPPPAPAR
ncbi:RNA-directed DNA polymerase [Rhodobacter capsulatus SB 1003]|uniref:RNA-directed DNA polymerase n=1 Tax=Rhodobacter capsulatus (strain ATCC BAA-309 / NBRC 16581 / SB1003) TaxID=272942 RepID=D5ASE1_RHOCB|nr:RNA-directed DNA polymerase [Rhodobacter capsulatus SB 1003]